MLLRRGTGGFLGLWLYNEGAVTVLNGDVEGTGYKGNAQGAVGGGLGARTVTTSTFDPAMMVF